jgi:hypothetical protein
LREEISFTIHLSISYSKKGYARPQQNYPSSFIFSTLVFGGVETIFKEFLTIRSRTLHTQWSKNFSFLALMRFFTTHKVSFWQIFSRDFNLWIFHSSQKFFIQRAFLCVFICTGKNPLKIFSRKKLFFTVTKMIEKVFNNFFLVLVRKTDHRTFLRNLY